MDPKRSFHDESDRARAHGRRKVTSLIKANIMNLTDDLFHTGFDEIAAQCPQVENEHWIIDIGAATPSRCRSGRSTGRS